MFWFWLRGFFSFIHPLHIFCLVDPLKYIYIYIYLFLICLYIYIYIVFFFVLGFLLRLVLFLNILFYV